jgi:Flp pilus assembly pilin Flp
MFTFLRGCLLDDEGQDIAECAVMVAVILIVVIGTIRLVGSNSNPVFSNVASSVQRFWLASLLRTFCFQASNKAVCCAISAWFTSVGQSRYPTMTNGDNGSFNFLKRNPIRLNDGSGSNPS